MELLKNRLRAECSVMDGNILKVHHFLNHQIDVVLMAALADEMQQRFKNEGVTKILTVESSGIAFACLLAERMGVPVLFAKKAKHGVSMPHIYLAAVGSDNEHGFDIAVAEECLTNADKVLVVDDFLAKGSTVFALLELIRQAGASAVGCGIIIEKVFEGGGERLRDAGIRVESLTKIAAISRETGIAFVDN